MPGLILHEGAIVLCAHFGTATPTAVSTRVFVSGAAITTTPAPYQVAGCPYAPSSGNGPCATANWLVGALRVKSLGQPVVISTGSATCVPTGAPLLPLFSQTRVTAT